MEEVQEVDLRAYFSLFYRRFWVLVLTTAVALAISGAISYYLLSPVYSATTTLIVMKKETPVTDYGTVLLNQQLVKTYREILKSRRVAADVIAELHLSLSYAAFEQKVTVDSIRDTELLRITVEDKDPDMAAVIANVLAEVFMRQVADLMKVENIAVIDPALPSSAPVRPRPLLNLAAAGVLGIMTGLALIVVLEHLDNSIETAEDAQRYLGLPILGAIPAIDARAEAKRLEEFKRQNL